MRTHFEIADGVAAQMKLAAVAIVPWLSRDGLDIRRRFEFADAPQYVIENGAFQAQLQFVGSVLVVAAAAAREVGAGGRHALRRRRQHLEGAGAKQPRLLPCGLRQHGLAREHEGRQDHPAVHPPQALSAVNQFFDREFKLCLWVRHRVG
ncbi:MAG: hypothetical protein M1436_00840 [Acidobacteria bacterium]|nr:hypothetical protein [Acidobacteriota bacterium]